MPSLDLAATALRASPYCVLGYVRRRDVTSNSQSSNSASLGPLAIRHLALLSPGTLDSAAVTVRAGSDAPRVHVCRLPEEDGLGDTRVSRRIGGFGIAHNAPTTSNTTQNPNYLMYVGCFGAPLSGEVMNRIEAFIAESENDRYTYLSHPPVQLFDPRTGKAVRRYSCVGFVLACYESVGILLLADMGGEMLGNAHYPMLTFDQVAAIYPELQTLVPQEFDEIGLVGGCQGQWQVVMPGYVLHALAAQTRETPYLNAMRGFRHPSPFQPTRPDQVNF